MRLGDFEITRSKRTQLLAEDEIMLTMAGHQCQEKGEYADTRGKVLTNLSESGNQSIKDIADDCRLSVDKVKAAVSFLILKGYARKSGIPDNQIRQQGGY